MCLFIFFVHTQTCICNNLNMFLKVGLSVSAQKLDLLVLSYSGTLNYPVQQRPI